MSDLLCGFLTALWMAGSLILGLTGSLAGSNLVYEMIVPGIWPPRGEPMKGFSEMMATLTIGSVISAILILLPLWWPWGWCG